MKTLINIFIGIGLIVIVPAAFFTFYLMAGYIDWLNQDPLDLIVDNQEQVGPWQKDWEDAKAICEKDGGIAIRSGWDGQLKNCKHF